jgi:hypothetical protein
MPNLNAIAGIVPNWNSRKDPRELSEIMHHMKADLKDIKQSWVPSLAPKPRGITPDRTHRNVYSVWEIGY